MTFQTKLLEDLEPGKIISLEILSFEPDLYLADIVINNAKFRVYRSPGVLLKEHSQLAIKKHFKGLLVHQTYLLHQSAYDEMIGNTTAQPSPLKISIANPDQDYS